MADNEGFNKSIKVVRTPPASSSSVSSLHSGKSNKPKDCFITNDASITCNLCENGDDSQKLRCGFCRRWWHTRCSKNLPESKIVNAGKWKCEQCVRGSIIDVDKSLEITRVELTAGNQPESTLIVKKPEHTTIGQKVISKVKEIKTTFQTTTVNPESSQTTLVNNSRKPQQDNEYDSTASGKPKESTSRSQHLTVDAQQHKDSTRSKYRTESKHGGTSGKSSVRKGTSLTSNASQLLQIANEQYNLEAERIKVQMEKKLLEEKLQLEMKEALVNAKIEHLKQQRSIINSSSRSSNSSQHRVVVIGEDAVSEVASKVEEWLNNSRRQSQPPVNAQAVPDIRRHTRTTNQHEVKEGQNNQPHGHGVNVSKGFSILNPNVTVADFVEGLVRNDEDEPNLSSKQVRARQVLSRELPEFDGNPIEWPSFASRFAESTKRCGFSEVENLDRLSRCLKGAALRAVKTELYKKDALSSILATLRMLFGRPEVVYATLVSNIRNGPTITEGCLENLVTYSMSIKTLCDTLKTGELQDYLYNPLLLMELIDKLPINYRIMWGNYAADQQDRSVVINLDTFNDWLRRQAEIYSAIITPKNIATSNHVNSGTRPKKLNNFQGAHVTINNNQKATRPWIGWCHMCKISGHITAKCPELMKIPVAERWEQVKTHKLCMKCLGRHYLKDCGSDAVCGKEGCTKAHHPMLHKPNEAGPRPSTSAMHEEISDEETLLYNEGQRTDRSKTVSVHSRELRVKFQILPVIISDGNDSEILTYAFLDNGSEVTLISKALAKKLHLSGPTEKLKLKWSNDTTREEDSQRVKIMISDVDRKESFSLVNVRTVPTLCLPSQSINVDRLQRYPHLRTVPLATYENAIPEILIGLDNYQLLMAQETVEGKWEDPIAVRTRIGWTLYGSTEKSDWRPEVTTNIHQVSNDTKNELRSNTHVTVFHNNLCPEISRFSSLTRLVRTQAQVLRFFHWGKQLSTGQRAIRRGPLTKEELIDAENYVIRQVQQEEFGIEQKLLAKNEPVDKSSVLKKYTPFKDQQGLIRSRSRLQEAEYLTFEQRCPVVLPKRHMLTKLIGNMTDDPEVLKFEWKRQQLVVATFWKRFIAEYLPEISQRTKWFDKITPLSNGDVVAIANSKEPESWQLGRVKCIIPSKDGNVRQAEIQTANGIVKRPMPKLAVLIRDLKDEHISSAGGGVENSTCI